MRQSKIKREKENINRETEMERKRERGKEFQLSIIALIFDGRIIKIIPSF